MDQLPLKRISEGVFEPISDEFLLTSSVLDFLEADCKSNRLKRSRINYHKCSESNIQEMILAMLFNTIILPHSHTYKDESFHMLKGRLGIAILDENKPCIKSLFMLQAIHGPFFYRIRAGVRHLIVPISEICVVHETTQGPFIQGEAYVPKWACDSDGADKVMALRNEIQIALS